MNRRELGIAVLGAAAGVAGCSSPVTSLIVPSADAAAGARSPDTLRTSMVKLRRLHINSNIEIWLEPAIPNYWTATQNEPPIARIIKSSLESGVLYADIVTWGNGVIEVRGKNAEVLAVVFDVVRPRQPPT
jgi:hypothetical protein